MFTRSVTVTGWLVSSTSSLSLTYIGMIERGEKIPKLETFIKITNTLGVSADQLLAGVLTTGYSIKSTEMTAKIEQLPPEEQEKIYEVVDTLIKHTKK